MKYKINVRKLTANDFSRDCNFPITDNNEYIERLAKLVSDIENLSSVNSVRLLGDSIMIESNLAKEAMLDSAKSLFQRDFCAVRYMGIDELP